MTDHPGPLAELAWLPVDKLDVDPSYQRSLDTKASQKLIQKIADNFRWISFQAILATPQGQGDNKRWLIIDGQHRVAAAKQRGIKHVPAVVVAEASQAEQASAFVGANRDRAPMQAQHIFHARLVAGDADCQIIARICKKAGIQLYRYNIAAKQFKPGWTAATPALLAALRRYGERATELGVAAVAAAYKEEPSALRAPLFLAAAMFLHKGGTVEHLRAAFARLGWRALIKEGIAGGPQGIALSIVEKINGCRAKAGEPAARRTPAVGNDLAGRLPARRSAGATEVVDRDSRERPAPSIQQHPDAIPEVALAFLRARVVPMLKDAGMSVGLNAERTMLRVDNSEPMNVETFIDWVNERFELEGEDALRLPMHQERAA